MRYRLAIFDLDGTLSDSFPWFLTHVNTIADRFGFRRVASEDVPMLRRAGPRETLSHLEVPRWKVPRIARHMRQLKTDHGGHIKLFPGVDAMLATLKAHGITTAMVSSDNEANVRRSLGSANVARITHFDCGASLFGKAAKFKRVMRLAGARPEHTIAIGDELRDLEAARKAGIAFGAVAWGYANPDVLRAQSPEEFFSCVDEIARRLTLRGTFA